MASAIVLTMIGGLLAFRITQSYARWHTARAAWGLMITRLRSITRQVQIWTAQGGTAAAQQRVQAYLRCFGFCLMVRHSRGMCTYGVLGISVD